MHGQQNCTWWRYGNFKVNCITIIVFGELILVHGLKNKPIFTHDEKLLNQGVQENDIE